jgi:phosphopentomutase
LTFANFVEFDTLYGHPRDVSGYARALEWFDAGLPRFFAQLRPRRSGDLYRRPRQRPDLGRDRPHPRTGAGGGLGWGARELGLRGFVDVAASVAAHLGVTAQGPGRSFL